MMRKSYAGAPAPSSVESNTENSVVLKRKVIQNGRMSIDVKNIEQITSSIENIVTTQKGYIDQHSKDEEVTMEIRIPSAKLKDTMTQIASLGWVSYQRVWSKDVTGESIDIDAKLKNLRLLRTRLLKLYNKSADVKSLIEVEKELARVQGEIDVLEGRQKVMERDVAYSKLDLTIEKESVPGPLGLVGKGVGWTFKKLWVLN